MPCGRCSPVPGSTGLIPVSWSAVPELAAANWLVSAEYLMDRYPGSLLVDLGSTTTDIIPLSGMAPLGDEPILPGSSGDISYTPGSSGLPSRP